MDRSRERPFLSCSAPPSWSSPSITGWTRLRASTCITREAGRSAHRPCRAGPDRTDPRDPHPRRRGGRTSRSDRGREPLRRGAEHPAGRRRQRTLAARRRPRTLRSRASERKWLPGSSERRGDGSAWDADRSGGRRREYGRFAAGIQNQVVEVIEVVEVVEGEVIKVQSPRLPRHPRRPRLPLPFYHPGFCVSLSCPPTRLSEIWICGIGYRACFAVNGSALAL